MAVYLITGGNRGKHLALALLQRENTTVITTSRRKPESTDSDGVATSTSEYPTSPSSSSSSRHISILLDEEDEAVSSASLAERLREGYGIVGVDVVVANAGTSAGFNPISNTKPDEILHDFKVNALGPAKLFQATWPLLNSTTTTNHNNDNMNTKKFILITSSVGSIASLPHENLPSTAYGMSKAAANWFAKKVSVEFAERGLVVGIFHPGWVKTPMGQALADAVGFPEPPMEVADSARAVLNLIDKLSPETSGQFLNYDGAIIPW